MAGRFVQKNGQLLRAANKFQHIRKSVGLAASVTNWEQLGTVRLSTAVDASKVILDSKSHEIYTDLQYVIKPQPEIAVLNKPNDSNVPSMKDVAELIKEDCQLPEHIQCKPGQKKINIKDISTVLLTGCTGTLGPYILKELTNRSQVTRVICLVRPQQNISEENRLRNILHEQDLLSEVNMTKVSCVSGNVALPFLGLDQNVWGELCNNVDAVFQCAASINHVEHYKKRQSDRDTRAINVTGTNNILEFACTGSRLKQVYFASSTIGVASVDKDGRFSESWPQPTDFDGVTTLAYPITKFVGDMLMKQAVLERGIPGKVFRFPFIVGDSKTGRCIAHHNHFMLRNFFMLQHKLLATHPIPVSIIPVDIGAWASVQIFFNPNAPEDIYNICNANPVTDQELISVAKKFGFDVDIVTFPEFSRKIRESSPEDTPLAIFKQLYSNDNPFMSWFNKCPEIKNWVTAGFPDEDFMVSKKIAAILPEFYTRGGSNTDHLYRDLLFSKNQGSNNLVEFWDLLFHGEDGTCKAPTFWWTQEQNCGHMAGAMNTNAGFLKVPMDKFDANFFVKIYGGAFGFSFV